MRYADVATMFSTECANSRPFPFFVIECRMLQINLRWVLVYAVLTLLSGVALSPPQSSMGGTPMQDKPSAETARFQLSAPQAAAGWICLFDQQTSFAWRSQDRIAIENSAIVLRAEAKQMTLIRTAAEFSDFELEIEYELPADSAAELLVRSNPQARQPGTDHLSIPLPSAAPEAPHKSAMLRIRVDGNRLQHFQIEEAGIAGALEKDSEVVSPQRGYLGFRVQKGTLTIHRVWLKPLPQDQVYQDLAEWESSGLGTAKLRGGDAPVPPQPVPTTQANTRPVEAGSVDADVSDGAVSDAADTQWSLQGGPGSLESNRQYADFILQTQIKASETTNSGIFFRCIPGERMNGYESQIQNQMQDNNPLLPLDCGTGGIFRRINARRIVAKADQWFTKTIIVNGGNVSVWVDGYQVTDWSDQRQAHPNPRKGRRTAAGTVQLQAHDPTTDVHFRRFWITELPSRNND